ncbi:ATP-binding protein [Paenibacillus thermoaerophilus]|uniref:histidine kinase n=1 Tax=Paenibacillus thermoaerophilus TaxID=1215385 RepID=A0ABW2V6M0_9BACL|nr:ATP-binding protein [Paenibacillus thermoaerophilus]
MELLIRGDWIPAERYTLHHVNCGADGVFYLLWIYEPSNQHSGKLLLHRFADEMIRHFSMGVLLINADFCLVDISETACRILGFERDQVVGLPMDEVFAGVPPEHRLVQRSLLDGVVHRNHAVSWTNDADRYELLLDSNLLLNEFGGIEGAYVLFKDVTNLRSLEQQVQRSDRLAMIGQIAAGTAHEIRNPLTSIRGFLQMLNRNFQEAGQQKESQYTSIMLTEIDRINELVNEFLLLGKSKDVVFSAIDVQHTLAEIMPIIRNQALLHGIDVEYKRAERMPLVIANGEMLKQVFINICKNGIEAMASGGVLTVQERVDAAQGMVYVEIHDQGPGIPPYLVDKIFDPFFTTKEEGTGLGLAVCQRIIHDIGGVIRVASKGYGTTFYVGIPYGEAAPGDDEPGRRRAEKTAETPDPVSQMKALDV